MSSDDYFDEEELDSAFLQEVEAIEAAHMQNSNVASSSTVSAGSSRQIISKPKEVIEVNDEDDVDDSFAHFDLNEDELRHFDEVCGVQPASSTVSTNSRAPFSRTMSIGGVQMNLFGEVAVQNAPVSRSGASTQRTASSSRIPIGRQRKTKQWDHTAFAKTGWRKPKGKAKAAFDGDEEEEEEDEPIEFEQFPAPQIDIGPPPPMKLKPDLLAARRWIYPLNQPKRDYQFNIVKRCLFENTLVALPTGLGKTFIAGVVMLNFYTWFPEGKVLFVAPTKPLVAQQIEACHRTCGIPGGHAVELTGQNNRLQRAKAWRGKRVFYMTPQTLMNDLKTDNCDPRDIVLLVIDEAHKGTGDYAYAQVIRYMMAKNPHFRVLALTATPGSTPEAVQDIVDCLHISHIEIRDENSLDLRAYMHKKHLQQHIVSVDGDVAVLRDMLAELMLPIMKQLQGISVLRGPTDPIGLHPYRCQAAQGELHARRDKQPWAFTPLANLTVLARAMGYLMEASTGMCYTTLKEFVDKVKSEKNGRKNGSKLIQDPKFTAIMKELEKQHARGFSVHPKMERLKTLLVEHFAQRTLEKEEAEKRGDIDAAKEAASSRVMVFASFRECIDEVVELLNEENPLIRARKFVGQGTDKKGQKGYGQKEQLEVLRQFKAGEFNVLVSTSVGEEGLDIGEVDLIVCYDAQKTPIRMLQRVGRTGRKRDGYVHVLLSEGREERNWDKAMEKYETVQNFIVRAEQLELFDDVVRMIPNHIDPKCVEMEMDIEEYVREDPNKKRSTFSPSSKAAAKRKRNDDVMRNIPAGAANGFVSVKDLLLKGVSTKKRKKPPLEFDPSAYEEDDDDRDIEAGIFGPRRTASLDIKSTSRKKQPRRAKTMAGDSGGKVSKSKRGKKKVPPLHELTPSQLDRLIEEDSDDLDIEAGPLAPPKGRKKAPSKRKAKTPSVDEPPRTPPRKKKPLSDRESSLEIPLNHGIIDLTTPDISNRPLSPLALPSPSPDRPLATTTRSRRPIRKPLDVRRPEPLADSPAASPPASYPTEEGQSPGASMAWLVEGDSEPEFQFHGSSPMSNTSSARAVINGEDDRDSDIELTNSERPLDRSSTLTMVDSSPIVIISSPPPRSRGRNNMPPPADLPVRFSLASPSASEDGPSPSTFAVRAPGRPAKKKVVVDDVESSPVKSTPPVRKRLQRQRDSPPPDSDSDRDGQPRPKRKKRKFQNAMNAQKHVPWIDVEATHSGEERSVGGSDDELIGDSSDREFVQELPETQMPSSYDQSAIYRQSLLTQAPVSKLFSKAPNRRGVPQYFAGSSRVRHPPSSSPDRPGGSDDYVPGSFVVDDDAEISYTSE